MQVPEKLVLIGGSILLSSTLVFTLKSQASSIIPSVGHSISHVFDHIGDTHKNSDFDNNFKKAQKNGWLTGKWGTAKYYIGKDMNMHVGGGDLQGSLHNLLGSDNAKVVKTISIDQPVQAPQDSTGLFSTSKLWGNNPSNLTTINGLSQVDTSKMTNMTSIFCNDYHLSTINGINSWNVSNVKVFRFAFNATALTNLDLSNWDARIDSNVYDTVNKHETSSSDCMFGVDTSLQSLDISRFTANGFSISNDMFGTKNVDWSNTDDRLTSITLGNNTHLKNIGFFPSGSWQDDNQKLSADQLIDGNAHQGTWVRQ